MVRGVVLVLVLVLVAACGRFGFETIGDGGGGDAVTGEARLASIQLSSGGVPLDGVTPLFGPATFAYHVDVGLALPSVEIVVAPIDPTTTIAIDAVPAPGGASSAALALGETTFTITAAASGGATASYTITVNRAAAIAQQAYVKASNTGGGDVFGTAVAMSGDTLVVGAIGETSNATGVGGDQSNNLAPNSGAVYVFTRTGSTWAQQAYLKASNTEAGDFFGGAVSISGDTLAVGAQAEASNATGVGGDSSNNAAANAGAVYVFTRTGSTWAQQAYVKASNTGAGDQFGFSVSVSGDTLAVGAPAEASGATGIDGNQADNSAAGAGAVYVFTRTGSTWAQQAYVKASNTGAADQFGFSVSVSGDTLAVGGVSESSDATGIDGNQADNSQIGSGAVYVFARSGATWTQQAYVKASNTDSGDVFGCAVSVSGDTLAVGALSEPSAATGIDGNQADKTASGAGAVYVFTRTGSTWAQQAYVKASNTDGQDEFGVAVSVAGDTLAIGADAEASAATGIDGNQTDNSAVRAGAVYLFARTGTAWAQLAYIKASNTEAADGFGHSIAVSVDTLAVGAYRESSAALGIGGNQADNSANQAGAVYVLE